MDGECIEYWIWLQQVFGAGSPKPDRLLRYFGGIREIYDAQSVDYMGAECLNDREIRRLCDKSLEKSKIVVDACMQNGYTLMSPAEMPTHLCNIYAPPCVLYVWGTLPQPEDGVYVAMVGTRDVTAYGVEAATKLAAGLAHSGAVVVSGMALGVDAASHKGALKAGGKTIAVIGCGIDVDYPVAHRELKRLIAQNGAVVSEYPPGARPDRINFPTRNRIIAGLSLGTVVVEAGGRSGALITASLAAEMGRDIFAVPGSIFSPMSEGTNRLLRDGAKPVCTVIDIIEEYMGLCPQSIISRPGEENIDAVTPQQLSFALNKEQAPSKKNSASDKKSSEPSTVSIDNIKNKIFIDTAEKESNETKQKVKSPAAGAGGLSEMQLKVYNTLSDEPKHVDDISLTANIELRRVLAVLTTLEIEGFALSYPGRRYSVMK
jgi:DNA processing protein